MTPVMTSAEQRKRIVAMTKTTVGDWSRDVLGFLTGIGESNDEVSRAISKAIAYANEMQRR